MHLGGAYATGDAGDTFEIVSEVGAWCVIVATTRRFDARSIAFDPARNANTGVAVLVADLACVVAAVRHAIGLTTLASARFETIPGIETDGAERDTCLGAGTADAIFCNAILTALVHTTLGLIAGAQWAALAGVRIARFAIVAIVIVLAPGRRPASPVYADIRQQAAFSVVANARNRRATPARRIRWTTQLLAIAGAEAAGVVATFGISGVAGGDRALGAAGRPALARSRSWADARRSIPCLAAGAFDRGGCRGGAPGGIGVAFEHRAYRKCGAPEAENTFEYRSATGPGRNRFRQ